MIFNLAATFISATLFVPNVLGQAPTNTSGISPCIVNCTQNSLAAGGCTSITQFSCICTSIPFQTADGTCIQNNCPTEIAAAQQLQNATCGPYLAGLNSTSSSSSSGSGSTSGSHSSTGTAAPGTTGTAGTTHPAGTTTTTSSSAGFHTAGIASGVALALFGATFSLF